MQPKIINVSLPEKSHAIKVASGLVTEKGLPEGFVVTDKNVFSEYSSLIKDQSKCFVIRPGEKSKTLENYCEIISQLPEDTQRIIAFGGGVVGDLTGYIASTFKRGIELIQVPTSLMAMVDSSIGGKNGVNLGEKKNYIGSFYQPKEILIDPKFLESLPKSEFANGVAEIIKYSAIFGLPTLLQIEKPLRYGEELEKIIVTCATTKARVVEKDERDQNYRHTLNFGHTIGHAIELLYGLGHGEAIAIGMTYESELGAKLKIIDEQKKEKIISVIQQNELPTYANFKDNIPKIMEIMKADKKGRFVFAFAKDRYEVSVEEKLVSEVLSL